MTDENQVHVLAQPAPDTYSFGTDYGKDLLTDINQAIHRGGTNALVQDCLKRCYREITRLSGAADCARVVKLIDAVESAQPSAAPAEPCPYAHDGCFLERQAIGPCLCANPVSRSSADRAQAAIRNYLKLWDSCGGSTAVAASAFADARQMMRDAVNPGAEPFAPNDAWQELVHKDDRTSPEEYPDMCLISFDELKDLMERHVPVEPQPTQEPGSMSAQWAFDAEARSYYFAPLQASPPPYTTREVTAILDIANDGTLAGVEICEMRHTLPEPPITLAVTRPNSGSAT